MAIIIDGSAEARHEVYGGWEWMKKTIGADILEVVPLVHLGDGVDMWIDEEGKLKPHSVNVDASLLLRLATGGDYIAGTAIIVSHDDDGNEVDIPESYLERVRNIIAIAGLRYLSGMLGPKFVASGPRIEIRSLTEDEFSRMFGGGGK